MSEHLRLALDIALGISITVGIVMMSIVVISLMVEAGRADSDTTGRDEDE